MIRTSGLGYSVMETTFSASSSPCGSIFSQVIALPCLELQSVFSYTLNQFLDSAIVQIATSSNTTSVDVLFLQLCDHFADLACAFNIAAFAFKCLIHAGCGCQGHTVDIVDQLCIDAL